MINWEMLNKTNNGKSLTFAHVLIESNKLLKLLT